jgi:hypothetical protein
VEENCEINDRIEASQKEAIGTAREKIERSSKTVKVPYIHMRRKKRINSGHEGL